jgi:hypothetical protein
MGKRNKPSVTGNSGPFLLSLIDIRGIYQAFWFDRFRTVYENKKNQLTAP